MPIPSMFISEHRCRSLFGRLARDERGVAAIVLGLIVSFAAQAQDSGLPTAPDSYSGLKSSIPANPCSSYPQEPGKNGTPLPATNLWSGSTTLPATYFVCGDLQLQQDTTITSPSAGSVLVIENGQLDTNGYTLATASGSALTIVFSGTSGSYTHAPTGGGTLDIQAPSSGTWSGVSIYQDPSLTTGVDVASAGNPTSTVAGRGELIG